ncbi:MAG: type II secretion system F family protein [Eggerthellaceae bacterium]|nr:type II secretion system F family protein [Eggerthellaceae bacterium]
MLMSVQGMVIGLLPFAGAAFAGGAGFFGWSAHEKRRQRLKAKHAVTGNASSAGHGSGKLQDALLAQMEVLTSRLAMRQSSPLCPGRLAKCAWFQENIKSSGLEGRISLAAFCDMRMRLALVLGAFGMVIGYVFSSELALMLAMAGAACGWMLPKRRIRECRSARAHELEAHLPEMLDVLSLGMRSGLSFDSALSLYCKHFKCPLAAELARAQEMWRSGLESRQLALKGVAASYASPMFTRIVDGWVRTLGAGTSMAAGLADEAKQARDEYKAKREERIAKAPVKMMLPVGTLILPAMLLLVLGPVMLNLMEGGI